MANNSLQIDATITENGNIVINFKIEHLTLSQLQKIVDKIQSGCEKLVIEKSTGALKIPRED